MRLVTYMCTKHLQPYKLINIPTIWLTLINKRTENKIEKQGIEEEEIRRRKKREEEEKEEERMLRRRTRARVRYVAG